MKGISAENQPFNPEKGPLKKALFSPKSEVQSSVRFSKKTPFSLIFYISVFKISASKFYKSKFLETEIFGMAFLTGQAGFLQNKIQRWFYKSKYEAEGFHL